MNGKVLVVDDESVTRRLVTHTLKPLAVEVISAEDGNEALQLAGSHEFKLALVDINLPDIDGLALLKQLKAMPALAEVPIYIFTARNRPDDKDIALEFGAKGFFYKPFSTQELRDLVRQHIDN